MITEAQKKTFIDNIAPIIVAKAKAYGYKYPSAIIGQACIESAYGTSTLGYKYHNYFGMKCGSSWTGKSVNMQTKEEYNSQLVSIRDNFRAYDSDEEGIEGYFEFIDKPRYQNLKNAVNSKNYLEIIKSDGYATSSSYVNTVYSVVAERELEAYDTGVKYQPVTPEVVMAVINNEYGNGAARQANLAAKGYLYLEVQSKVNEVITNANLIKDLKKDLGDYWEVVKEIIGD